MPSRTCAAPASPRQHCGHSPTTTGPMSSMRGWGSGLTAPPRAVRRSSERKRSATGGACDADIRDMSDRDWKASAWLPSGGMARMLLGLLLALLVFAPSALADESDGVIVRFKSGADAGDRDAARQDAGTKLDEVLPVRGLQVVAPAHGVSRADAIRALQDSPDVLYAEPDRIRSASVTPNDHFFDIEWGMDNTGQDANGTSGTPDAD